MTGGGIKEGKVPKRMQRGSWGRGETDPAAPVGDGLSLRQKLLDMANAMPPAGMPSGLPRVVHGTGIGLTMVPDLGKVVLTFWSGESMERYELTDNLQLVRQTNLPELPDNREDIVYAEQVRL